MAFFTLNSDITIGSFRFSGVHEVRIKRSMHSYADTASIKIPSACLLQKGQLQSDGGVNILPGAATEVITADQFNYRDAVTIRLGYNGVLMEEFRGFVKRCNADMPLEVECEGYIQPLRLDIDLSGYFAQTSAGKLLNMLTDGTGISVQVADDITFYGLRLQPHANGEDVIRQIKQMSQGTLTIFFVNPSTLWCGFTYTAYTQNKDPFGFGVVNYRLGYNVVKNNGLKQRVTEGEPVTIIMDGILATGQKIETTSQYKYAQNKVKALVNNIGDVATLQRMANEKQYQENYAGYEGAINAFLQPYASPGYQANIVDDIYPERNGIYLIESTEVTFGINGSRRKVEIGPKMGFVGDPGN